MKKKTYKVQAQETYVYYLDIEAESENDAIDLYYSGEWHGEPSSHKLEREIMYITEEE